MNRFPSLNTHTFDAIEGGLSAGLLPQAVMPQTATDMIWAVLHSCGIGLSITIQPTFPLALTYRTVW